MAFLGSEAISDLCEVVLLGGGLQGFPAKEMARAVVVVVRGVIFVDVLGVAVFAVFLEGEF